LKKFTKIANLLKTLDSFCSRSFPPPSPHLLANTLKTKRKISSIKTMT